MGAILRIEVPLCDESRYIKNGTIRKSMVITVYTIALSKGLLTRRKQNISTMQIRSKLIIALSVLGLLLCAILYVLMQWSFDRGMIHYINQQERSVLKERVARLAEYYQTAGNWQSLVDDPAYFHRIVRGENEDNLRPELHSGLRRDGHRPPPRKGGYRRPEHRRPEPPPRDSGRGRPHRGPPRASSPALLDVYKQSLIGQVNNDDITEVIMVSGDTVGWLAVPPPKHAPRDNNLSIKDNLGLAFALIGLALVFLVLFVGLPLAQHFVKPLRQIAKAANALTRGDYSSQLPFKRKDEIGALAKDFEVLSATLKANEASRSRWVADISHELRTPLAIAAGEVEAMLEGVRAFDKDNLSSVKQEIDQLNRLVNDLYELANAEIGALRYNKAPLNIREALMHAVQRFEELFTQKNLQLECDIGAAALWVNADVQRLNQLFNNLLVNELKYADTGAKIRLSLQENTHTLQCVIEDSGPGLPEEHVAKLFDYMYRVDSSRNRKTGGAGLGLSICFKIVEAHQGQIQAARSELGGLKITVTLPLMSR
ncbi:MAG: hypothetical protein COA42_12780 [Alteromonadaceae bacterium]|nr:MAG: hypothetical protein COA42_12780 [Alteromonadaceae bacterium]